jgi:AcrR family transcriptional regulator
VALGSIANRVGMSKSGLFAHFKSKEKLGLKKILAKISVADMVAVVRSNAK